MIQYAALYSSQDELQPGMITQILSFHAFFFQAWGECALFFVRVDMHSNERINSIELTQANDKKESKCCRAQKSCRRKIHSVNNNSFSGKTNRNYFPLSIAAKAIKEK